MTYISRKEVFDILDHFHQELATNENEDLLIKRLAKELLQLKTYEIEEEQEVKKWLGSPLYFSHQFSLYLQQSMRSISPLMRIKWKNSKSMRGH